MMKRFTAFILSVLVTLVSVAQTTTILIPASFVVGHGGSSGTANANTAIPILLHTPPDAEETLAGTPGFENIKYPIMIVLHGIESRTSLYTSAATVGTGQVTNMFGRPPMRQLRTADSSLVGIRYSSPGNPRPENLQFFYIAPQVWGPSDQDGNPSTPLTGGYTHIFPVYVFNVLRWIKANLSDIVDTTRIYLTGLSFGGGGTLVAIQDSAINVQIAAAAAICPGYDDYPGQVPANNWAFVARSGIPLFCAHATNDPETLDCGGGSGCSVSAVTNLINNHPLIQPRFYHYTNGGHAIWDRVYNPQWRSTAFPLTTGATANMDVTLEEWFLQFTTRGRRRPIGH